MLSAPYQTKKALKASVGKPLRTIETSMFGTEYRAGQMVTVVGPSAYDRRWYAQVWTDENGIILKVK